MHTWVGLVGLVVISTLPRLALLSNISATPKAIRQKREKLYDIFLCQHLKCSAFEVSHKENKEIARRP